jgi:ABC-type nitrate/sulfonate/bicarbonate transport system substrate-binding protein
MKLTAVITASVAAWFFSSTQMVYAEADKVNFLLDWVVYGRATPYFVAFEKGFFSARNIEPKIERGYGSAAGLKRIAAGQAEAQGSTSRLAWPVSASPAPQARQ